MVKLPTISIVTCSLNTDLDTFKQSLESIKAQDYPRNLIEHILMDGGSSNGGIELAKKYNCKVYVRPDLRVVGQKRQAVGILLSKKDLILILEPDNILVGKNMLRDLVRPFQENKEIFCTFTMHHGYEKNMSMLTKYTALYGSPDPTLFYLKKTEKVPLYQKYYDKGKVLKKTKNYYVVKFTEEDLPTLGDNGHMFRREIYQPQINPETFSHVDTVMNIVKMGNDTCGVVKGELIHVTEGSLLQAIKKRLAYKQMYYDDRRGKRSYLVFNWHSNRDIRNLLLYVFFSLTVVEPFIRSLVGYTKIREKTWFIHPVFSFCMVIGYGYTEMKYALKKIL